MLMSSSQQFSHKSGQSYKQHLVQMEFQWILELHMPTSTEYLYSSVMRQLIWSIIELFVNTTKVLVMSWLFLHTKLFTFSKFLMHAWSQCRDLNEEQLYQFMGANLTIVVEATRKFREVWYNGIFAQIYTYPQIHSQNSVYLRLDSTTRIELEIQQLIGD